MWPSRGRGITASFWSPENVGKGSYVKLAYHIRTAFFCFKSSIAFTTNVTSSYKRRNLNNKMLNYAMSKGCCPMPEMFRAGPCCPFPSTVARRTEQKLCPYSVCRKGDNSTHKNPCKVSYWDFWAGIWSDPLKLGFNQLHSLLTYHHFRINPLNYPSEHACCILLSPHPITTSTSKHFSIRYHSCLGISRKYSHLIC